MKNYTSGFTLLELIIVIVIIGIMAAFGISNYPGVQKTAQDTHRMSDLKQYHTSLETYANKNGGFYTSRTSAVIASGALCTDLGLSQCPADPKTGQNICAGTGLCNYYYISNGTNGTASATSFVLFARLEKKVNDQYVFFVVCSNGSTGNTALTWTPSATCPL